MAGRAISSNLISASFPLPFLFLSLSISPDKAVEIRRKENGEAAKSSLSVFMVSKTKEEAHFLYLVRDADMDIARSEMREA